jgi:hypothetical protein
LIPLKTIKGNQVSVAEPSVVSLLDLAPNHFETWEERACIMHFDGELPWPEAEAAALADVLRGIAPSADPEAAKLGDQKKPADALRRSKRMAEGTGAPMPRAAEDHPPATVQTTLFSIARGPYG